MVLHEVCTKHLKLFSTRSSLILPGGRTNLVLDKNTGELAYDSPLYAGPLSMTDDMLGPSPMHIKYVSYVPVYDRLCI